MSFLLAWLCLVGRAHVHADSNTGWFDDDPTPYEPRGWGHVKLLPTDPAVTQRNEAALRLWQRGDRPLLHFHIRKCAGTTFCHLAVKNNLTHLDVKDCCNINGHKAEKFVEPELLSHGVQYLMIESPLKDTLVDVNNRVALTTALRHPVARVVSNFFYYHSKFKSQDLSNEEQHTAWKKFLKTHPEANNYMVAMTNGYDDRRPHPLTRADVEKAKRRLHYFNAVMIVDWFPDSSELLTGALGIPSLTTKHVHKNHVKKMNRKDYAKEVGDPDLMAKLLKQNALDMELWEYAAALSANQMNKYGLPLPPQAKASQWHAEWTDFYADFINQG